MTKAARSAAAKKAWATRRRRKRGYGSATIQKLLTQKAELEGDLYLVKKKLKAAKAKLRK